MGFVIVVLLNRFRVMNNFKKVRFSKNFTLDEFVVTSTGIDNIPGPNEIESLRQLTVNILQPLRDYFGKPLIITSGYRSPLVNAAIGGSSTSQHTKGEAADFNIDGVSNEAIVQAAKDLKLPFDQIIDEKLYRSSGRLSQWVHVSHDASNRKEHLIARNSKDELKAVYSQISIG